MTYEQFLVTLSKPAKRALLYNDIDSFERLAALTEKEVLDFHGIGLASLPKMNEALSDQGLKFTSQ